ncbi:HNH endonuclease signature motif containing protein [Streptococcus parauberis]|uniref:HNH endonuclease domain protein n=1 Tax=Streptococcus parauberis NCFD 2020 TaxID=873447 RepID=F1Z0P5_9STRE|nr:HNH endonuclease signature motif containing protein [Streptococcus parauberis]EGE53902.1 HNH endonuclease domain protein [Streptococcus parauberis NCFD 2020]
MKHPDWFRQWQIKFYNNKKVWHPLRNKIRNDRRMRCDMCGKLIKGKSIVDHIIEITPQNYMDESITLNEDNLQLLCFKCHQTKTFGDKKNFNLDNRSIDLFHNPPMKRSKTAPE